MRVRKFMAALVAIAMPFGVSAPAVVATVGATVAVTGAAYVAAGVVSAPEAEAASVSFKFERGVSFKGHKSYHPATVKAGLWKLDKHIGYCPEFGKGVANSKTLKAVTVVPGMKSSDADSKAIMYLANKYYTTKDKQLATNVGLAIWVLKGDSKFNSWYKWSQKEAKNRKVKSATAKDYVSAARAKKVAALVKEARGGYNWKLTLKVEAKLVGQTGTGTLVIVDGKGKPVSGIAPSASVTSGNATVTTKAGKTNSKGVSTFKFRRTDTGVVSFKASVSGPSGVKVLITNSSAGRQRLVIGGTKASFSATAQFDKTLNYTVNTVCDSDCNGVATVTFASTLEAGASPTRFTFSAGGESVTYDVAPGQTASKSGKFSDGAKVSGSYAHLDKVGGKVTSKSVSLGTVINEVICPPWLKVSFTGDCNCDGGSGLSLKLTAPGGARFYLATVKKNGTVVSSEKLGKSGSATVSVALAHGDSVSVDYGAYRNDDYKESLRGGTVFSVTLG